MNEEQMLFATEDQVELEQAAPTEVLSDKYLIFVSDNLRYGLKAEQVGEIITNFSITYIPHLPHYVRGIVNLRGQLIPIIDIRLRLGKMPADRDSCFITMDIDNTLVGILVDGVEKMVDLDKNSILPMPSQNELVSGMCSLPEGGTMLVLDCDAMMHG